MEKITLKPDIDLLKKHYLGIDTLLYYVSQKILSLVQITKNLEDIGLLEWKEHYYLAILYHLWKKVKQEDREKLIFYYDTLYHLAQKLPSDAQITENLELEVNISYYEKFQDTLKKTEITELEDTLLYIGLTQFRHYQDLTEANTIFEAMEKQKKDWIEFTEFFLRNGIYKGNKSGYKNIQEIIIKTNSESFRISNSDYVYHLINNIAKNIDEDRIRYLKPIFEPLSSPHSREKESTRQKKRYAKNLFDLIREIHPDVPKDWIYHCIGLVFYISGIVFVNTYDNTPYNPFAPDFHPDPLKNNIKKLFT